MTPWLQHVVRVVPSPVSVWWNDHNTRRRCCSFWLRARAQTITTRRKRRRNRIDNNYKGNEYTVVSSSSSSSVLSLFPRQQQQYQQQQQRFFLPSTPSSSSSLNSFPCIGRYPHRHRCHRHHNRVIDIICNFSSTHSHSDDVGTDDDPKHSTNDFGRKLRDMLASLSSASASASASSTASSNFSITVASCKEAEDVLRTSLEEIRILRTSRIERHHPHHHDENSNNDNDRDDSNDALLVSSLIRDCILLLNTVATTLPSIEEYYSPTSPSSLLFPNKNNSSNSSSCSNNNSMIDDFDDMICSNDGDDIIEDTDVSASSCSVLEVQLLNELLKEWLLALQHGQVRSSSSTSNKLLPTPTQMAEIIDRYRSCMLLQPNATSYNILLNAMMMMMTNANNRQRGVNLADDYLRRLVRVQQQQQQQQQQQGGTLNSSIVDVISFTTVIKGWVGLDQPNKAQELFDKMQLVADVSPNAITYSTLIHGFAKAGHAMKAETLLLRSIQTELDRLEDNDGTMRQHQHRQEEGDDDGNGMNDIKNNKSNNNNRRHRIVDRIVFHTVIDAWAAKAVTASTVGGRRGRSTTNVNTARFKKKQQQSNDDIVDTNTTNNIVPALRAKHIVDTMDSLANDHYPDMEYLRPNKETWYKLICAIASQQQQQQLGTTVSSSFSSSSSYGPMAAEEMLDRIENNNNGGDDDEFGVETPAVVLNRMLRAYITTNLTASTTTMATNGTGTGYNGDVDCNHGQVIIQRMIDAEDFYHRRISKQKQSLLQQQQQQDASPSSSLLSSSSSPAFPNAITFNTILTGWANTATDYYSSVGRRRGTKISTTGTTDTSSSSNGDNDNDGTRKDAATTMRIPERTEVWLQEMTRYGFQPSTRSYGSMLQAYCATTTPTAMNTRNSHDQCDNKHTATVAVAAAERAEDILKRYIFSDPEKFFSAQNSSNNSVSAGSGGDNDNPALGITICTNIVLRAWSNLTSPPPKPKKKRWKMKYSTMDDSNDGSRNGGGVYDGDGGKEDEEQERIQKQRQIMLNDIGRRAVGRCVRLLENYLIVIETEKPELRIKPNIETFRRVLYAITSPAANTISLTEKCNIAQRLFVDKMNDTYNIQFHKEDRKKINRLFTSRDNMVLRRQQRNQRMEEKEGSKSATDATISSRTTS